VNPLPEGAMVENALVSSGLPVRGGGQLHRARKGDITAPLGVNRRQSTLTPRDSQGKRQL
jgi:hypothetical protein